MSTSPSAWVPIAVVAGIIALGLICRLLKINIWDRCRDYRASRRSALPTTNSNHGGIDGQGNTTSWVIPATNSSLMAAPAQDNHTNSIPLVNLPRRPARAHTMPTGGNVSSLARAKRMRAGRIHQSSYDNLNALHPNWLETAADGLHPGSLPAYHQATGFPREPGVLRREAPLGEPSSSRLHAAGLQVPENEPTVSGVTGESGLFPPATSHHLDETEVSHDPWAEDIRRRQRFDFLQKQRRREQ